MQEIPFSYRIKKLIQRANPMDFIELVDGRYYWIYEGELKQLADLMMLSKLENGDPRLTAIMDKGITCLRQIDDYLTWLGCEGLDAYMHCGNAPIPPIPDWLVWHELMRLNSCNGNNEIDAYIRQTTDYLVRVAKTYPPHRNGWLIHAGPTADFVLTVDGTSSKIERGENVVTHVCFSGAHRSVVPNNRSENGISSQRRPDEPTGIRPFDAGR